MSEDELKPTKMARILFEQNISLTDIHNATGVAYPTLINLKKGRNINYRQRTLQDVASYLRVPITDILEDIDDTECNTPFEKALKAKGYTLQKVHEATGVAYPILTNLRKGKKLNYRKRTLRDICDYLEITEEELLSGIKEENGAAEENKPE